MTLEGFKIAQENLLFHLTGFRTVSYRGIVTKKVKKSDKSVDEKGREVVI